MIYALSDSTSNLIRHMLAAFLTQFPGGAIEVRYHSYIRREADLDRVLAADARPAAVVHAVVLPELKRAIAARCRKLRVPSLDLTGAAVEFLGRVAGVEPHVDPQRLHRVDEAYHDRIEAMEFTMNHDDGLGLPTLHEADVVLAGISRTSKTPTCIFLAQNGLKAANYALAMQSEPPQELLQLPAEKVVGLLISAERLAEIRYRRAIAWNMPDDSSYNDERHVIDEITWSRRLFAKMGWRTIDVTDQAVEETAGRILQLVRKS